MIYIYTTSFRETYFDSVRKALSLPTGASQRFTYDDKYVHPSILKNPEAYKEKEAIVLYIQKHTNDKKTVFETSIPLRKVRIKDIIFEEDIVTIDFVHTDDYWQPDDDAPSVMKSLILLKRSNKNYFVFEGEDPKTRFARGRKSLFHFLLGDKQLMVANGRKIDLLYAIDVLDGSERASHTEGVIYLKKGTPVTFRIYFYSNGREMTRGFKIFTHLGKIEFPIDYDENDLRSGIIDFLGYPNEIGLDSVTLDVDTAYLTTFVVKVK